MAKLLFPTKLCQGEIPSCLFAHLSTKVSFSYKPQREAHKEAALVKSRSLVLKEAEAEFP